MNASDRIWIAAIGPDIPVLGVRRGVRRGVPSTQSQVAATIAAPFIAVTIP